MLFFLHFEGQLGRRYQPRFYPPYQAFFLSSSAILIGDLPFHSFLFLNISIKGETIISLEVFFLTLLFTILYWFGLTKITTSLPCLVTRRGLTLASSM